jgi:hypothetical protein
MAGESRRLLPVEGTEGEEGGVFLGFVAPKQAAGTAAIERFRRRVTHRRLPSPWYAADQLKARSGARG